MAASIAKALQFIKCIIFIELIQVETGIRALLLFSGIY
jgi:hypothetical protein